MLGKRNPELITAETTLPFEGSLDRGGREDRRPSQVPLLGGLREKSLVFCTRKILTAELLGIVRKAKQNNQKQFNCPLVWE